MDFGALNSHWPGGCEFQSCNPWVPEHLIGPPHNLVSTLFQCWQLVCNLHWPTNHRNPCNWHQFITGLSGIFSDVASSHSLKAGGLQVIYPPSTGSARWVQHGYGDSDHRLRSGCWHTHSLWGMWNPTRPSTMLLCAVMSNGSPGHRIEQASYVVHNQACTWHW